MKGKRLVNISLIALLALGLVTVLGPIGVFGAISPNSPADACYIVPDQVIKLATSENQHNDTTFTITVIAENFVGVAGFQIKIAYNSTLLQFEVDGWTFDTGSPMSPTQLAPGTSGRVDTNASIPGLVQLSTVWTAATPTYTYSGNSTMATIDFRIIWTPGPQPIFPDPALTVSCALDSSDTETKLVDTNGDDILFTNVYDGYYQYTLQSLIPDAPDASFVYDPLYPHPSDTVTLTDTSLANGAGDYITARLWEISGPANITSVDKIYGSMTYDVYLVGGYGIDPVEPSPDPDPAGFDVTIYQSYMGDGTFNPAPVINFGNISVTSGNRLRAGYSAYYPVGAAIDIQNLLGVPITIEDLTVQMIDATHARSPTLNYSQVSICTLDQGIDDCNYTTGAISVSGMPNMEAGVIVDRVYFQVPGTDPLSSAYILGPLTMLANDTNGDAAATGHVAPIPLAAGDTFREYFGPVHYTQTDVMSWGEQSNATIRFTLTYYIEGPTVQFHCDGPGDVEVSLTVWDNQGLNDTEIKVISQTEAPAAEVDLWTSANRFCGQTTDKVGKGFGSPADAISPDVNVTFYALVTYGGAPLAHRLVGFEIVDNQDNNVVTRTAETDKQGVARIWWRMPFMNPPDQIFGTWNATVSVKIQDTKVYDYMAFKVGWVVTITSLETDKTTYDIGNPDGSATDGDFITVTVGLKNIMMMDKEYYLAVTIYDDCDVPILKLQDSGIIAAEFPWCNPGALNVTLEGRIPHWAYVGVGKVYASVYTMPPFDCGTPYSPEESLLIQLVWTGELFADP